MNWLILVAASVLAGASCVYTDNYISDAYFKGRGAVAQKFFFAVIFPIVALITMACCWRDFAAASPVTWLILFISGLISSLGGIPYYRALELDDSTNLGIFVQTSPILYLVLGWLFLSETISPLQLVAFCIILSAPLLIIFGSGRRSRRVKARAALYASLYVIMHVIGNLIFVAESTEGVSLPLGIALVILGKGIGNIVILLFRRDWVRRWKSIYKSSHRKILRPMFASFTFDLVYNVAYKFALLFAPSVALASAVADSAEPIAIFFMGIVLTLIWPKIGREKLTRRNVIIHLIATALVVTGVLLLKA